VKIPATIGDAKKNLNGIDVLLRAKEWERAAIVYAFTRDAQGERNDLTSRTSTRSQLGIREFAALGISGLKSDSTVRQYRNCWQRAVDAGKAAPVKPGDDYVEPDMSWDEGYWQGERGTSKDEMFDDRYMRGVVDEAAPAVQVETFERLIETPAVRARLEQDVDLRTRVDNAVEQAHRATHPEPLAPLAFDRNWEIESQLLHVFNRLYWAYGKVKDGHLEPERVARIIRQFDQIADWANAGAALLKGESPARELLEDIEAMLIQERRNV
jgi:hypothetical protein